MNIDQRLYCTPLPFDEGNVLSMAFDGCYYYFALQKEVVKTNLELKILCRYPICREYSQICYDWKEQCFWAASPEQSRMIYRLSATFHEEECIMLMGVNDCTGPITGISYECCYDKVLVSYENIIVKMDKDGHCKQCLYMPCVQIRGLLSLCPGCIISVLKKGRQCIALWSPEGQITEIYYAEPGVWINTILYNPCGHKAPELVFLIYSAEKAPCLYKIPFDDCNLGFIPCKCNHLLCEKCCEQPKPPHPEPMNCSAVLESIALEEAAISHILNAEGEKIQKILAITDDFDKIMCVNREVNETIVNVTILEQTLYAKLLALNKLCPFDSPKHCAHCVGSKPCTQEEDC